MPKLAEVVVDRKVLDAFKRAFARLSGEGGPRQDRFEHVRRSPCRAFEKQRLAESDDELDPFASRELRRIDAAQAFPRARQIVRGIVLAIALEHGAGGDELRAVLTLRVLRGLVGSHDRERKVPFVVQEPGPGERIARLRGGGRDGEGRQRHGPSNRAHAISCHDFPALAARE
jgi:hypothetical protein